MLTYRRFLRARSPARAEAAKRANEGVRGKESAHRFFAAYRYARNAGRGNRKGADRGRATGASEGNPETRQTNTQQPPRTRPKRANGGDRSRTEEKGSAIANKGVARTTPPSTVEFSRNHTKSRAGSRRIFSSGGGQLRKSFFLDLLSFFVMG